MLLAGKKLIITGGVTGIGKATALTAAKEGASVVTMSRALPTDKSAVETIEACKSLGSGPFMHIKLDVSDRDATFKAVDEAVAFMGGLDCVVCSAAIFTVGSSATVELTALRNIFGVNVNGTIFTNQAAFKHLQNTGGSIVNFSSAAGVGDVTNRAAYSASKGAILAFSRATAKEWGKYNIRVNCVLPIVSTESSDRVYNKEGSAESKAFLDNIGEQVILGNKKGYARIADASEAANSVVFLASDMSKFITGQMLCVDGGCVMVR